MESIRPSVLHALSLLFLLAGCQSLHLPEATVQSEEDWLTEGGTSQRTYARSASIRPPLERAWSYNAGAGFGPGSPLVVNGSVLVGTRKGEVHAVDLSTGKGKGVVGMGESVDGTPVIDRFGILYVPVSWGRRGLYAYDLSRGTMLWRQKRVPVQAGLLLIEDVLITADVETRVVAYHARSGDVLWERTLSDRASFHAAPLQTSPTTFVVADDHGIVTAMDVRTGDVVWTADVEYPVYRAPALRGDIVFIPTTRGRLIALDAATGGNVFTTDVGHAEVKLTTPAVTVEAVYVGGSDGSVTAIAPVSGDVLWSHNGEEALGGPPLVVGDYVYTVDMAKNLRAHLRATGELVWTEEVSGRVKSAMAADDEGIIVLAEPRSIHYYKPAREHAASR